MSYCKKQANLLRKDGSCDEGKILLWELLSLMCKQNGVVIGTDVAELLLADQETSVSESSSHVTGYEEEPAVTEEEKKDAVNKIRECLFEGQRKEALEVGVRYGLWEIALMIGSTLSNDIMSDTMQRFSNSLHNDDPLKSFHQLISHVEPTACSADPTQGASNWRTHLAMILSNQSDRYDPNFNYVLTLANTLAASGKVYASHFACLMAGSKLTSVVDKTSPIALLGLDHTKEDLMQLPYSAIQLTEIYEYAKLLGGDHCIVPFQAAKFFYAREVAKVGHYSKALQYLQQISNNINSAPKSYRARFIQRVFDECVRTIHVLRVRQLPEWAEALRETLTNRNLGISNRSTAYSSRVATPDIQRVAQYLLSKQKGSTTAPEKTTQQAPAAPDQTSATEAQQQQIHQELLANGLVFDGQVYRHEMYPGWYYYESQWYPEQQNQQDQQAVSDSNQQQLDNSQQQPDSNQQQPDYGQQQPDYGQQQPDYGQQQPDYSQQQPNYGQPDPELNHMDQHESVPEESPFSAQDPTNNSGQGDVEVDGNEVDGAESSRQRQDTLTNQDNEPPPPAFTFFNPAQFSGGGGGSNLLAPLVPSELPPVPDQPLSDDDIKTPTNLGPAEDPIEDEDSVYSKPKKKEDTKKEEPEKKKEEKPSGGLLSRFFGGGGGGAKKMILPDDSEPTIYWDEKLGRYVDPTADEEDENDAPPPPTFSLPASTPSSVSGGEDPAVSAVSAPSSPGGSFRRRPGTRGKSRLAANRYVDVMSGGMKKSATAPSFN